MTTVLTNGYALCVCCLVGLLLQPFTVSAQVKVTGWGPYHLGKTTPDSLFENGFREQTQPLVKGTIALSCSHIRIFQDDTVQLENLTVTHVSFAFYDNKLFKISFDGSATVRQAFNTKYGTGIVQPLDTLMLCGVSKPLFVKREIWQNEGVSALLIRVEGYSPQCQPLIQQKLLIVDQQILALTSECELDDAYLFSKP